MWGTVVNAAAIVAGGLAGMMFNRALPARYQEIIFQGMGLFIVAIGVSLAIKIEEELLSIFALLLGGLTGELFRIDLQINRFGDWLKRRLRFRNERFTEGFVTTSLIYCVGAMSVLGAVEDGTGSYPAILLTKSVMDGFSAVAFASALGTGVIFSAFPVAVYQGLITLAAVLFTDAFDAAIIRELSAIGGVLLIGLGISVLGIKDIKVVNLLPAMVFVVVFMCLFT